MKSKEEIQQIEKQTELQRNSATWIELRRKLLTASAFHAVCTRRQKTKSAPLVKNLLYKKEINTAATNHGINSEAIAIQQLALQEGITIEPCGLFIDPNRYYLGNYFKQIINELYLLINSCL